MLQPPRFGGHSARGVRSRPPISSRQRSSSRFRDWKWTEVPIHYRNPSKSVGSASLKEAFRNLWALYRESRAA